MTMLGPNGHHNQPSPTAPTRDSQTASLAGSAPIPPALLAQPQFSLQALRALDLPLEETTYLALGGGLGSFTWVDQLLICGADPAQIVSIGFEPQPYSRYKRLCDHSQLPAGERLRSDSGSTPDNVWGWPGYALREIWADVQQGRVTHATALAWQIFTEPVLAEPFTPTAGQVYAALEREARRIGWPRIWRFGQIRHLRQTDDGRYAVLYAPSRALRQDACKIIIAPYLHLALGYPGLRFLPDLQAYREKTRDFRRVVNAYEDHDHVYAHLRRYGGTVLLRGRGIVASRLLQRLAEERATNPHIRVLHLIRSPISAGSRYQFARRLTEHHFEYQPYNFPKASFGGDLRFLLSRSQGAERRRLIELWGGVTTAKRRVWREIVAGGLREGWYIQHFGQVSQVEPDAAGRLVILVQDRADSAKVTPLQADFIIDATGLDGEISHNPLLADLLHTYQLEKNAMGRLAVSDDFEVVGLQNGDGRVYASGALTLGGPFAPVDSFIGLQYAAQLSLKALTSRGAPGLRPMTPLRSFRQWLRWVSGAQP